MLLPENDTIATSLLDILSCRAQCQSERQAYIFLQNGETESGSLTYGELDRQARAIAAHLQCWQGERALLLYPSGLEFITAFFGCLYAGVVAVPVYPPRRNQKLSRLLSIVNDAQVKVALTTTSILADIDKSLEEQAELAQLKLVATDTIEANPQEFIPKSVTPEMLAFLQYTSGSTGTPKGVMVTHGNIIHNQQLIHQAFGHSEESIVVGWLPLFHDMGLIGNVLQPMYLGIPCILMPPVAFLQKPIRWLQVISKYRATTSGGPNFAYDLCVKKVQPEQLANLDLSSWDLAFNGAEPVRAETLEQFGKKFADCGFNYSAFYPCYGMAETTLFATGGDKNQKPVIQGVLAGELEQNSVVESEISSKKSRVFVGCGRPDMDTTVIIVNPESLTRCEKGQVGEIWASGGSIASGYWNRPEATQETFQAYLKDTGEGPFLRTGDLGFLSNGELFVTGRLKDVIIIRGRNYYPQDIELSVENSNPSLRENCSAAFSVEIEGEERLVVACEVERTDLRKLNTDEIVREIQIAVSTEHELEVYGVVLLKTGSIPKTSSGKIKRRACKLGFLEDSLNVVGQWQKTIEKNPTIVCSNSQQNSQNYSSENHSKTVAEIKAWLVDKIAELLQIASEKIDLKQPLAVYGLNSVKAVNIAAELEEWLGISVAPTIVYDYPSIQALADYLGQTTPLLESFTFVSNPQTATEAVAIIGKGCRFPKANNPQAFWSLLRSGDDAITKVPVSRWGSDNGWGGFLEQLDQFDPQFFGISPREASNMDPQQRLLLEVSWEALENAGLAAERLAGSQGGVFIGISTGDYAKLNGNLVNTEAYYGTGNALSIAANRLSYFLDWHGPSWAVDTACSSSLVALHQACQSLLLEECNLALAGGVNLMLSSQLTLTFSEAQMMAADGRCKTFDAEADGYVRSEGCGVVVLKRLCDALADGDNIQAIIRGSAVNQDGLTNGLTAPNGNSQQEVIRLALAKAQVRSNQISYVETHGTGTTLGDPIEVNSLKAVLMEGRESNQPCWIGSVKTNIGHLEAAAGIAGLIKVVLSLEHKEIPPHLHLKQLNSYIKIKNTPIQISTEIQPWQAVEEKRLAGVSSFGFGGTNAHIILEEAPDSANSYQLPVISDQKTELLTLSAKTENALLELADHYQSHLETHSELAIADICFSANTGRSHFNHRLAVIAESTEKLRQQLKAFATRNETTGLFRGQVTGRTRPKIAFLFTGQGSQYANMGRELYLTQPTFRQTLEQCDGILSSYLDKPLLSILYPSPEENSLIDETAYTQPALFALEYALFQLWKSWGIEPDVVMGHSVGEYVAACVAGVFSLEDGLKLIAHRGRLMQALPTRGEMVAVLASELQVREVIEPLGEKVSIAAINSPVSIVISGATDAINTICDRLQTDGIKTKHLQVSHAFHSPLMKPMLAEFENVASEINYKTPRLPIISNLTGEQANADIATPQYWVNHTLKPVKFACGMQTLEQIGYEVFLEIGPKPILLSMGRQCFKENVGVWLPSLRPGWGEWQQILQNLAELYVRGVAVNWSSMYRDYHHRKVVLPTYPWQRSSYWIETPENGHKQLGSTFPENASTAIINLLNQGDTQQLAQQLEKAGNFSPEQTKVLPELLSVLVKQHQKQLAAESIKDWLYEVKWQPQVSFSKQLRANFLPTPLEINLKLRPQFNNLLAQSELEIYGEILTKLEALSIDYVLKAFGEMGWQFKLAERFSTEFIAQQLGVVKQHYQLLARLLEMLSEIGILQPINSQWEVTQVPNIQDPQQLFNNLLSQYPTATAELTLLERCASQLASVLCGESDPLQLVFPGGDLTTASQFYQESPGAKVINTLVQQAVLSALEQLPKSCGVRVLEIGAGTGGTTAHILPHLNPAQTEYVFTDLGGLFTAKAQEKFRDYPFVRYQTLDIEVDPSAQGFESHQYDLIVAANVLHATADLRHTLQHIKQLLAPGGMLVLLEGTTRQRCLDLIFGLTEGWWKFTDTDIRTNYPLLSALQWRSLLTESGFEQAVTIPSSEENSGVLFQQAVILAQVTKTSLSDAPSESKGWLILADQQGIAQQLAAQLQSTGDVCTLVKPGKEFQQFSQQEFTIDPNNPEDFQQLLATVTVQLPPLTGVVHLWCLDTSEVKDLTIKSLEASSKQGCGSTLHLVQALVKVGLSQPPRLWLVTQGAQPVLDTNTRVPGLAQSPLWGMGRVISLEHPELWGGILDLDPNATNDEAVTTLLTEISDLDCEDHIAFRDGQRYVARLMCSSYKESQSIQLKSDGTYLITGGLGFLGLKLAQWMVEQGARHLVLTGRQGLPERDLWAKLPQNTKAWKQIKAIQSLEDMGATVVVSAVDVSDFDEMSSILKQVNTIETPLRGIIHAAGIGGYQALKDMKLDELECVLRPKALGAWILHQLTKDISLDFFICFSSAGSVWGAKGQGHYDAANHFLDILAYYRRSIGLPAFSINWGSLGIGGVVPEEYHQRLMQIGLEELQPEQGFNALSFLLGTNAVQTVVAKVDWRKFKEVYQAKRQRSLLTEIKIGSKEVQEQLSVQWSGILPQLEAAPESKRYDLLISYLQGEVAKVLGLSVSQLPDPEQGFFAMGMDSLMAIELKNRLEANLASSLPSTLAFEYPNIKSLSQYIGSKVLHWDFSTKPHPHKGNDKKPDEISTTIKQLSESELEVLINNELEALIKEN
ncbi:beta-ketoacyl synthase [Kalymmatonema gypsitolerans NIES-4073]|nr:beta-ketoacyl synthase [Scytonema sp. NIES-4073]